MKQSKGDQAWVLFQSLMRQYPLWPSTFSTCDCGRGFGRGAGKCSICITEDLAKIVGIELAENAVIALEDVAKVWGEILLKAREE